MMDVKRTNPNGGRSILVPPKATIKFEAAAGPKFGPGPEAKPKPAPVQRVGSRNRSAGKDSPHGPDSSRLGSAETGTPSSGDASSRRRGSNAGLTTPLTSESGIASASTDRSFGGFGGFGGAIAVDNMPPVAAPRLSTPPTTTLTAPEALEVGIAANEDSETASTDGQLDLFSPISTQYKPLEDIPPEDIHLSDAVLEAFMQNSPSRTTLINSPLGHRKPTPAVTHMAKMRVVEEMNRIQQRAYVTEQQRQQLMQTALSMDAPKLARRIIQDEKDQDEAVAFPTPKKTGIAEAGVHLLDDHSLDTTRTLPAHTLHSQSAVSFLTAGELLMIDRRLQEEKAQLEELNKSNDDSTGDVTKKSSSSDKKYYNSSSESNQNSDIDENEVTIKRTKSFRMREQIQMAEDERFAKAVDEVERIRQRFIARAQLPLLGSADYESRGSGRIDTTHGAKATVTSRDGNTASTHVGAKVRKTGNGMLFSSRNSFHADEAPHSPAGDLFAPKQAILNIHYFQSGKNSARDSSGSNSTNITRQNSKPNGNNLDKMELHISTTGPMTTDESMHPVLSPLKNPSTLLPAQNKRNRRNNYSISPNVETPNSGEASTGSSNFVSNYPTPAQEGQGAKSIRPVPILNSGSIENLNANDSVYVDPFEAFERMNASKKNNVGTFASPLEDNLNSTLRKNNRTRKPAAKVGGTYQQAIADDIDMLIGSRFNSARDMDTSDEPENKEILGNSLVLLQAQLAEAANDEPQQYSRKSFYDPTTTNDVPAHNNNEPNSHPEHGGHRHSVEKAPRLLSAAAATALATLSRPNSANRRINSHPNHHSDGVPPTINIEHDQDPKQFRNPRTPGSAAPLSGHRHQLLSDESTSSLGSAMFAFKLDSKSAEMTPGSAERNYPNGHHYNTTSSSSLLVSETPSPLRNCSSVVSGTTVSSSSTGGVEGYSNGTFHSDVSRGLFQDPSAVAAGGKSVVKEPLSTLNETANSSFSYTDYMYQSSNDSSRNPNNYTNNYANPNTLAPLPLASLHALPSVHAHTEDILKTEHKPQTPQLQPIVAPTLHALMPNQASTPDLHITTGVSGQNSAEKKAQRAHLSRLSSFELNNPSSSHSANPTTAFSNPGSTKNSSINVPGSTRNTSLSTRNSLLAPRSLSRSRGNSVLDNSANGHNNSAQNAKIRNAQMLLTSPLSEWLNAGALMSQKGSSGTNNTSTALPHIEEVTENQRRSSKFTFEELQQANSLLSAIDDKRSVVSPSKIENSGLHNISTAGSSRSNSVHSGASLTSLLPSLADVGHTVDPSVVNKVYRSLNVLNSHMSNMNTANNSNYTSATTISPPNIANPTANVIAVDHELDSLLNGNNDISPRSMPSPNTHIINSTTNTNSGGAGTSRPNSRGPRVRGSAGNLISQSLADGPTANNVNGAKGTNVSSSLSTAKSVSSLYGSNNMPTSQDTSIGSVEKLSTPVHRELESVMNQAKRRERNAATGASNMLSPIGGTSLVRDRSDRSASSTISTVNMQRKQDISSMSSVSGDGIPGDKSNSVASGAASSNTAESQAQRLSALAAAFDAGDAVGKLMAQMVLLRKNDHKE